MIETVDNLILDLLEWIWRKERTYQETIDPWRTSCPRLPIWEYANDRGLVEMGSAKGLAVVCATPAGRALLLKKRPHSYEALQRQGAREFDATTERPSVDNRRREISPEIRRG